MLLLRRTVGFLIDMILFYGLSVAIDFLFKRSNLNPLPSHVICFGYACAVIIPIITLGKPFSHLLLKLRIENNSLLFNKLSLLFKYIIYYLILSSGLLSIFSLFFDFINEHTYFKISGSFIFRLDFVLVVLNVLFFFASGAKQNFFDTILKIKYSAKRWAAFNLNPIITVYLFAITWLTSTVAEYKLTTKFNFKDELSKVNTSLNQGYFPIEIFNDYTLGNSIFVRYEYTNRIITPSDVSSYIFNRILLQRQILAVINDNVMNDTKKRKELCTKLLTYCYLNPFDARGKDVMQTKITLVHAKPYNPFIDVQSTYNYYYDDKLPAYSIYGGFKADSVSNFYLKTHQNYFSIYISELSKSFNIPKDSIAKYMSDAGELELPEHLLKNLKDTFVVIGMKNVIPNMPVFPVVRFEDVEPMQYLVFNFLSRTTNTVNVSNTGKLFSDEKTENMFDIKTNYIYAR